MAELERALEAGGAEVDWPPDAAARRCLPRARPPRRRAAWCVVARGPARRRRGRLRRAGRAQRDPARAPPRGRDDRAGRRAAAGAGAPARGRARRAGERGAGPPGAVGGRSRCPRCARSRSSTLEPRRGLGAPRRRRAGAAVRVPDRRRRLDDPEEDRRPLDRRLSASVSATRPESGSRARSTSTSRPSAPPRLAGHVLLWERDGILYRLEGRDAHRGAGAAARRASSVEPERRGRCRTGDNACFERSHKMRLAALIAVSFALARHRCRRRRRPLAAGRDTAPSASPRSATSRPPKDAATTLCASASRASSWQRATLPGAWGVPIVTLSRERTAGSAPTAARSSSASNVHPDGQLRARSGFAVV